MSSDSKARDRWNTLSHSFSHQEFRSWWVRSKTSLSHFKSYSHSGWYSQIWVERVFLWVYTLFIIWNYHFALNPEGVYRFCNSEGERCQSQFSSIITTISFITLLPSSLLSFKLATCYTLITSYEATNMSRKRLFLLLNSRDHQ